MAEIKTVAAPAGAPTTEVKREKSRSKYVECHCCRKAVWGFRRRNRDGLIVLTHNDHRSFKPVATFMLRGKERIVHEDCSHRLSAEFGVVVQHQTGDIWSAFNETMRDMRTAQAAGNSEVVKTLADTAQARREQQVAREKCEKLAEWARVMGDAAVPVMLL
jgi:hypothetical protein